MESGIRRRSRTAPGAGGRDRRRARAVDSGPSWIVGGSGHRPAGWHHPRDSARSVLAARGHAGRSHPHHHRYLGHHRDERILSPRSAPDGQGNAGRAGMSQLLQGIDAGDLLQHMPSSVRTSLETLERAGTDWNAVGNLLAATPTTGVAFTGTGQWTGDLWEAVKWEFRSFLCTESDAYAELRTEWDGLKQHSPTRAAGSLANLIGARVGVTSGVIAPMVTWLLVVAMRMGTDDVCLTLPHRVLASSNQDFAAPTC